MITDRAAKLMRIPDYGLEVGRSADFVVWGEESAAEVIARCGLPLAGFKRGRRVFTRELPALERPPLRTAAPNSSSG
jgi:cytosine deaminase